MLKLLTISIISSAILFGADLNKSVEEKKSLLPSVDITKPAISVVDESVFNFEKSKIEKDKRFTLIDLKLMKKEKIDDNWSAYLFKVEVEVASNKQKLTTSDVILSNGSFVSPVLFDIKTAEPKGKDLSIDVDASYYSKENLIAGELNAPNRLVVFSDPVCPFCKTFVPELIKYVEEHPKELSLYFYHYPLTQIHPSADTIVKASLVLEKSGKSVMSKVYSTNLDAKESDPAKVLEDFNSKMNLDKNITLKDIEAEDIVKRYQKDIKIAEDMLINSTPTLFTNGKKDNARTEYKTLVK